ncbi:hypothetical protein O4H49_04620 [Kiloniella laminariae]|uniref:Lipoprotein n=1 Tax=Kiloniella laminariae TaxID=454162 RepID=A0ABT4LG18_9PROT|nr:hypothetical protein [Kiloniella laminariae]MCZ4280049.1 hypothetical protein [Kiloniella laminariae]
MLSKLSLAPTLLLLAGCVTTGSENYQSIADLQSKGLTPLSGEEITKLLTGNTLVGEYVTTPSANFENKKNKWMEYYDVNGTTNYRYCEAQKNKNWDCGKNVAGAWHVKENELCFSYDDSAIHDRCFQIYNDQSSYLIAATNFKSAGYVRARIDKISDGFVEDIPFSTHP